MDAVQQLPEARGDRAGLRRGEPVLLALVAEETTGATPSAVPVAKHSVTEPSAMPFRTSASSTGRSATAVPASRASFTTESRVIPGSTVRSSAGVVRTPSITKNAFSSPIC